jgi:hypothetical protein
VRNDQSTRAYQPQPRPGDGHRVRLRAAAASRIRGGTLNYAFRAEDQEWDDASETRVIHKISLHKCDINITRGA